MTNIADVVDRYTEVWNEVDTDRRQKAVGELWASDGYYANATDEYRGHRQIHEAIHEAYEDFVEKGFAFTIHNYQVNHDSARLTWHMVPAGGGDVAAVGTEFIVLGPDGLIRSDHQFMDVDPTRQDVEAALK
ncbi:nuclear transport factor 2 family protein [Streptomyces sp. NPDC048611]|uniref:nuclear transport factor 2 family protein n=1 Tax=Streptomyces sp. NPDC048611 TaxID=3155635 RepID=UPI0034370A93